MWGPSGLLAQLAGPTGTPTYAHADGLGSLRLLTDLSGGVVGRQSYDAFGQVRSRSGAFSRLPFGYTGQQLDHESRLLYLRARCYDPASGRFLAKDPIGFAGGSHNLYAYVRNNPTNLVDPSGLCEDPGGPGVRYCIERYIPTLFDTLIAAVLPWLSFDPGLFGGDNRGPNPNGGLSRTRQQIAQNEECEWTEQHSAGVTHWRPIPYADQGTMECSFGASSLGNGYTIIQTSCRGTIGATPRGSIDGPGPVPPSIQTAVTILQGPDGSACVASAHGTLYPAMEIWQYGGPSGQPELIFAHDPQATGHSPWDLFRPGPIPNAVNKPCFG